MNAKLEIKWCVASLALVAACGGSDASKFDASSMETVTGVVVAVESFVRLERNTRNGVSAVIEDEDETRWNAVLGPAIRLDKHGVTVSRGDVITVTGSSVKDDDSTTPMLIATTVVVAGVSGGPMARLLRVRPKAPSGFVVLGVHPLSLAFAQACRAAGREVTFIDSNPAACQQAEADGWPALCGSGLDEKLLEQAHLEEREFAVGLTANEGVNYSFDTFNQGLGGTSRFGALSSSERATMLRLEAQEGIQLTGNSVKYHRVDAYWHIDAKNIATVDFMGHPNAYVHWASQQANFMGRIDSHLAKVDFVVVDLTGAAEAHIYQVLEHFYKLPASAQARIIFTGW